MKKSVVLSLTLALVLAGTGVSMAAKTKLGKDVSDCLKQQSVAGYQEGLTLKQEHVAKRFKNIEEVRQDLLSCKQGDKLGFQRIQKASNAELEKLVHRYTLDIEDKVRDELDDLADRDEGFRSSLKKAAQQRDAQEIRSLYINAPGLEEEARTYIDAVSDQFLFKTVRKDI